MEKDCTIYKTANFIGKRWTLLILLELYKGSSKQKRYSILKKNLPDITPKILSTRLKELEKEGLIKKRIDTTELPIKSLYSLTKSGEDFIKIIKFIKDVQILGVDNSAVNLMNRFREGLTTRVKEFDVNEIINGVV